MIYLKFLYYRNLFISFAASLSSGIQIYQMMDRFVQIDIPNGVTVMAWKNRVSLIAEPTTKSLGMIGLCGTFTR